MVQIIQEKSFGSDFGRAIGAGVGAGVSEGLEERAQRKKALADMEKENREIEDSLGIKLRGTTPEARKAELMHGLKLQQEEHKQKLIHENKQSLQQEKQDFLDKILSGTNKNENEAPSDDIKKDRSSHEFDPINLSDEDIIKAEALGFKGLREAKNAKLKAEENKKKEKATAFQSDRDYHSKVSQPIIDSAQEAIKQEPIKKALINQQRRDIASGNTSGIIPYLIEQTGLEIYRNPESARFKTASKQRFVESIHELGGSAARPNQFIEQQLVAAQPTLGRDPESNQTVLDLEEFVEDMKNQRAHLELKLAEEDREKYGYARNDIAQRAEKMMGDYSNQRQEKMAYDIQHRHEDNMSDQDLINDIVFKNVSPGTPLTERTANILVIKNNHDKKKAQAEAIRLGYELPKNNGYKR